MKSNKLFLLIVFLFSTILLAQTKPDSLLDKLEKGNTRYVTSKMIHPNISEARRKELAKEQHPFAVIVSCSDSRVPPELVFDQGLGDLFVIRTAGEVVDDIALASIEYAVEHLKVKLIVVMGHQRCGAVDAAVKGGKLPPHLNVLVDAIMPAVIKAKKEKGDLLDNAVRENVLMIVNNLKNSKPVLHEFVEDKDLHVVGAYYSLSDGKVTFIPKKK